LKNKSICFITQDLIEIQGISIIPSKQTI